MVINQGKPLGFDIVLLRVVQSGVLEVTQPCNDGKTYPAGIMQW